MAEAPGHLLGQIIGSLLEMATEPPLRTLVERHGLFLDVKGFRPGVREGKLLSLPDADGNTHDLDFVIERSQGHFAAFIECAWRRYTKHSKAKAQEIQGAVLPLVARWATVGPIPAAVVAGQWSRPSIKQLESSGFVVLQLDFQTTVEVFSEFNIDIKGTDKVPDAFWQKQVDRLRKMAPSKQEALARRLRTAHQEDYDSFIQELELRVVRDIKIVRFYPIHGKVFEFPTLDAAVDAIHAYEVTSASLPFIRFEVEVLYTNGDVITGNCSSVEAAEEFLKRLV